jgi:hypothetical protein
MGVVVRELDPGDFGADNEEDLLFAGHGDGGLCG